MIYNPLYILTSLCVIVVICEWLVRNTFLRYFGTALIVILVTAIFANVGVLPTGSSKALPVPVYDAIFGYVAPISIFWLLLRVNLKDILKAGPKMIFLFLISSIGTLIGVLIAMKIVNGPTNIGDSFQALGGMFVGTYTGGSINFNALALHYNVVQEGGLYTGAVAVDNIVTAIWMVVTLAIPKVLAPFWKTQKTSITTNDGTPSLGIEEDTESIHPFDLGVVLALGIGGLLLSNIITSWLTATGIKLPMIIILTIIALIIAQLPIASKIKGSQTLGMFAIYIFLAVIGAFCDLTALSALGQLGFVLLGFTIIAVLIHGIITIGAGKLMRMPLEEIAMISQANVGGGTTALALARSVGRNDLVLPAVLLGALGNAVGTFLGFWASEQLLPMLFG